MKKKGSALILSILMLSFFMTITLTMYYIARNRNKRSIYKIKGMRISSGLDSGSAIAHYELYLADEYVSRGHLYATSGSGITNYRGDNEDYNEPTTTTIQYTSEMTSGSVIVIVPKNTMHYTGVVLNNYNEYFGAKWDPTITGTAVTVDAGSTITDSDVLKQPWIAEDKVIDGKIVSRAWLNNGGEKIVRLWTLNTTTGAIEAVSVGGYRLIESGIGTSTSSAITGNLSTVNPMSTTDGVMKLVYEKIVSISSGSIGIENYKITYVEEVTTSGGSIFKDELNSMTVEKLK